MRNAGNNSVLVKRVYRANRIRHALQTTIISAVTLGATLVVGLVVGLTSLTV